MDINVAKLSGVIDRLAGKVGGQYLEAAVTIGEIDGTVFRLVAMSGMYAEDEDCTEAPEWAKCVTSNVGIEPPRSGRLE